MQTSLLWLSMLLQCLLHAVMGDAGANDLKLPTPTPPLTALSGSLPLPTASFTTPLPRPPPSTINTKVHLATVTQNRKGNFAMQII